MGRPKRIFEWEQVHTMLQSMSITAVLKKCKAKLGFSAAIVATLWMLNTYPPSAVVWHYIAWMGVIPAIWLIALLMWISARIKRRVYFVGLPPLCCIWIVAFVFFWPRVEPLQVKAFYIPAKYASGSVVGGISWEAFYTDVRVQITNPSDVDYKDVDVLINATDAIDRIGQISRACRAWSWFLHLILRNDRASSDLLRQRVKLSQLKVSDLVGMATGSVAQHFHGRARWKLFWLR